MSTTVESSSASKASLSPRHRMSRVSSFSGSFSQKSLANFKTVSLPGLFPGTHLGILASGVLDKRRDGAVRGGWANRFFVLSTKSLHYYRKTEEIELFGKERGQILLQDIGSAMIVRPEDAPYGAVEQGASTFFFAVISKRKTMMMFLRAESMDLAASWVTTINKAIQTAKGYNFVDTWTVDSIQNFITAASSNFVEEIPEMIEKTQEEIQEDEAKKLQMQQKPPKKILVVSVISTNGSMTNERLIKRHVDLKKNLSLGVCRKKDTIVLTLTDGEELMVTHETLGDFENLITKEKELVLKTSPKSKELTPNIISISKVTVSFRGERTPPTILPPSLNQSASGKGDALQKIGSNNSIIGGATGGVAGSLSAAFSCSLGGLFLLSCIVSFSWAPPFEGLMKITIILGFLLSLSQIIQFILCASHAQKEHRTIASASGGSSNSLVKGVKKQEEGFILTMTVKNIEIVVTDQDQDPTATAAVIGGETNAPKEEEEQQAKTKESAAGGAADAINAIAIAGSIEFSPRFIAAEKGDEKKGRQRFQNTLEWREENGMDRILVDPHPHFDTIKKYYPQYFHGKSKNGHPVYYEQPGKIDLTALKKEGLTIEDLLRHYMYITEYLWRVIEPKDDGRSVTVLDVAGIGMYDLGGDVLDFIKRASAFSGAHYPERSRHIFIINIPGWFNMMWRIIKPLIDPVTREKVHMLKGNAILRELENYIDSDQIPSNLGGKGVPLGESKEENDLKEHVHKYLK